MALESQPLSIANVIDGKDGQNGTNGTNGEDGKNGVSVIGVEIGYAQSTSGTVTPTTGWQTTPMQPIAGQYIWTRTRNMLSDGTFTNYVYVATFNGRDAVVVSDTAPTNPQKGTLWQKPSDPTATVLEWNGTTWVNWGISLGNVVSDNIISENGVFKKVTGLEVEGGKIVNPFDYWEGEYVDGTTDQLWYKGQTTIEKSSTVTTWQSYNKTTGAKIREGGNVSEIESNSIFINDPSGYSQRTAMRIDGIMIADSRGLGNLTSSFLTYNDLVKVNTTLISPASGWSRYNDSLTNSGSPKMKRTGRIVQLAGAFKPNGAVTVTADLIQISGQLPLWARPDEEINFVAQGSGMNRQLITIKPNGYIYLSRYGKTDYVNLNGGEWINISQTYSGADII